MSNLLVWAVRGLLALCLQICCPAARFQKEESVRRDPAYAVYETYRYAYERYGYLFSYAEETGGEGTVAVGNRSWQGEDGNAGAADREQESTGADGMKTEQTGAGSALSASSLARLQDYDYLMKQYFSVHASTTADRGLMKVEKLLGTDVRLTKNPDVPQILIYHTHASETYADYGPQNPDASVAGAGSYLAELLRQRGWNVIHDTTAYDRKEGKLERSRAYTYALEGVQGILQEHPTIEVILDLHRDGVSDSLPAGTGNSGETHGKDHVLSGNEPYAGGRDCLPAKSVSAGKPGLLLSDAAGLWPLSGIYQENLLKRPAL